VVVVVVIRRFQRGTKQFAVVVDVVDVAIAGVFFIQIFVLLM
jgi:hypothetical protein